MHSKAYGIRLPSSLAAFTWRIHRSPRSLPTTSPAVGIRQLPPGRSSTTSLLPNRSAARPYWRILRAAISGGLVRGDDCAAEKPPLVVPAFACDWCCPGAQSGIKAASCGWNRPCVASHQYGQSMWCRLFGRISRERPRPSLRKFQKKERPNGLDRPSNLQHLTPVFSGLCFL
jgi:hypothetical protein